MIDEILRTSTFTSSTFSLKGMSQWRTVHVPEVLRTHSWDMVTAYYCTALHIPRFDVLLMEMKNIWKSNHFLNESIFDDSSCILGVFHQIFIDALDLGITELRLCVQTMQLKFLSINKWGQNSKISKKSLCSNVPYGVTQNHRSMSLRHFSWMFLILETKSIFRRCLPIRSNIDECGLE